MYVRMIQLLQRKKNNVDTEDRAEECRYDSQIVMRHGAYGCNSTREYTCQDMKKSTAIKSFLPINKPCQFLKLHILGSDGRSASRGRGQNCVVLLNVNESDVTPGRGIGPRHTPRHSVYKGDRAKVGGWNIWCKILEQPLRALKAKRNTGS